MNQNSTLNTDTEIIRLSVRQMATFLLRSGSIDSRFSGLDRATKGSRAHRMLQKKGGKDYSPEVALRIEIEHEGYIYHISGRADGVVEKEGTLLVDEIKTTVLSVSTISEDDNPEHWGQAKIYAHILCAQKGYTCAKVQLSYYNVEDGSLRRMQQEYTAVQLADFMANLLMQYHPWTTLEAHWSTTRNASLQELTFPFESYRRGQRQMAIACYNTFRYEELIYCEAPTGIGKTLSTLFPAMKAMGEGYGQKIFYLTAKTITRKAASQALNLLDPDSTLEFKSIELTAKDKICFLEERACLPELCPYAKGYYDRINDALFSVLQTSRRLGREEVEAHARKYSLCPYELSLDIALWSDCIIGDFNYLFDPVVRLQRFFGGDVKGDWLFLVDEAHNLVDRSRDMYSASLQKTQFFSFKKLLPKAHSRLHKALSAINSGFITLRKQVDAQPQNGQDANVATQTHMPSELEKPLEQFMEAAELFLEKERGAALEKELLALYFAAGFYQTISQLYSDAYATLIYINGSDVTVKLFCLDPSEFLSKSLAQGRGAVLFSATLSPLQYYRRTLGGQAAVDGPSHKNARLLLLGSPFEQENLGLFIASGISTKYTDRSASMQDVAAMLYTMANGKLGNYIAFFPSYSYMRQVHALFIQQYQNTHTATQTTGMSENERDDFLAQFTNDSQVLAFCVMGGIFGEGIDLVGNRLIGTAIVGVGLPQIGPEPNTLRDYYDQKTLADGDAPPPGGGAGFDYAYRFPGMNKVMQAAGRVIRTTHDRGIVLLIDSRFARSDYQSLFPTHWQHQQRTSAQALPAQLAAFWQQD